MDNSLKKNKKTKLKDPHAAREAERYEQPIPSREHIVSVLESAGPLSHQQLAEALAITDDDGQEALRRRLIAMERDGQLMRDRRKAYGCVEKMSLLRGRIQGHRDGYGFFIPNNGSDDLHLNARQMQKVFDGDEVLVRSSGIGPRGKPEGVIVEVLSRNTDHIVGRYYNENGIRFVRPDNVRLCLDVLVQKGAEQARQGQYVVIHLTQQPDRNHPPAGNIIQVLGDHMAPGMEIDVAIRSHQVPHIWSDKVLAEADALPATVDGDREEGRVDLRNLSFVTIDGEDARDFDDAVYCENKKGGGWRLWVAIADVSSYVLPKTALDAEAYLRGNSVYFPDHVIPMLPEAISNGLCSLNPEVDRLVLACEMTISAQGRISGYQFYEAVIYSHARLTYTQVGEILTNRNKQTDLRKKYQHVLVHLENLHDLYRILRQRREERGAIDFDTVETRIVFDELRKIKNIVPVQRNDAHKLIEECMLCANVCAAKFLETHKLPGLYRVHEGPTEEKLNNLREFLGELGLSIGGGEKPTPQHYQQLLAQIGGRPDAHVIETVMLRSLRQAMYQPENKGHFGLAYPAYGHFTSPIRRYPDLLVHRAIRSVIRSKIASKNVRRVPGAEKIAKKNIYPYDLAAMVQMGEHCSLTERRADDATRDVISWLKCEYLQDRVGEHYEGVVAGVTGFGLFVELKNIYVEGLVHITSLPRDYYYFEANHHRLVGENERRVFQLGDELLVQVVQVNLEERKIDLELIEIKGRKTRRLSKAQMKTREKDQKKTRRKKSSNKKNDRSNPPGNRQPKKRKRR